MSEHVPSKSSKRPGTCPTCGAAPAADSAFKPFCGERCKMVDLGRWFRGEYVVAGEDAIALDPEFIETELRRLAQLSLETKRKAERAADGQAEEGDKEGGSPGSED